MSMMEELLSRSGSVCELCGSGQSLEAYHVPPDSGKHVLVCSTCLGQIEGFEKEDIHHWRCLNDSMWSTEPAVQVVAWRMLMRLRAEGWPQDLLDMMYLDEQTLEWATSMEEEDSPEDIVHKDSNGAVLQSGDTVSLIKDLDVKGAGFTAKRGTAVRNIGLVDDNPEHIEGRVNGQRIVILTKFVKKSNS